MEKVEKKTMKKSKDTVLFKDNITYKILNINIKRFAITLGAGLFIFIIMSSFIISHFLYNWEKNTLQREINTLDDELVLADNYYESLKKDFYYQVVSMNLDDKIMNIVELINPRINRVELKLWLEMVYENDSEIETYLNDASIRKILSISSLNSVKPGVALFLAMGAIESDFRIYSVSRKGAIGGFQVRKVTLQEVEVDDHRNPRNVIKGGIKYLTKLLKKYKNYPDQLELALASYNAGITRVREEWVDTWGVKWDNIEEGLSQSEKPYNETLNYVSLVKTLSRLFSSGDWANLEEEFWQKYRKQIITKNIQPVTSYDVDGGEE